MESTQREVSPALVTATAVVLLVAVFFGDGQGPNPGILALVVGAGLLPLAPRHLMPRLERAAGRDIVVKSCVAVSGAVTGMALAWAVMDVSLAWVLVVVAYTSSATIAAFAPDSWAWRHVRPSHLFIVGHAAALTAMLRTRDSTSDVYVFLRDSAAALRQGVNPYGLTFPNVYDAEQTAKFYGPGVVVDDRITFGFPYPPLTGLWAVVGSVFGDVRFASLIALVLLVLVLHGRGGSSNRRRLAVLAFVLPGSVTMLLGAWTEVMIASLLALTVWCFMKNREVCGWVVLGLLLSSKQYMVVALPCLWLLRAHFTLARAGIGVAAACLVNVPFLLWDPAASWRSLVEYQLIQPFRKDALSLLVGVDSWIGHIPSAVQGALPLVGGIAFATLAARRLRPGPAAFSFAVAGSLLVTVLLSKQAFLNYYYLVGAALLISAWAQGAVAGMPAARGERPAYAAVHDPAEVPVGSQPQ